MAMLLLAPSELGGPAPVWLARFEAAGGDKLVHAVLFFVQAALLARTLQRLGVVGASWKAVAVAAAYGLALELLQLGVDGRGWEAGDVLADVAGAGLWSVYRRLCGRRR